MSLLFNMLSRLVITFLPRSKRLLISWLQSASAVISCFNKFSLYLLNLSVSEFFQEEELQIHQQHLQAFITFSYDHWFHMWFANIFFYRMHTWKNLTWSCHMALFIHLLYPICHYFVEKVMSLLFNMLSRLVINFLPRSKCLLISWLQSPSAVILEPRKIKSATVSAVSPSICQK